MKGLCHFRNQYYKYTSEEDLKKIKIDGYQQYYIDEVNGYVRYQFDLQYCVRLDILLKAIRTIKIRGGQLLLLMKKIIDHCDYIRQHNSTHLNLQTENVWLILLQGSEQLTIVYRNKLDYKIHFTGYGNESQASGPNFICKQVLIEIINVLDKQQDKQIQVEGVSLQIIKQKLLERIQLDTQQQFKDQINKILDQFKCSQQSQFLNGLDAIQITLRRPIMQAEFERALSQISNIIKMDIEKYSGNQLQLLCCQLNAENHLSNYYLPQVYIVISQNLSKPDIHSKFPLVYQQKQLDEVYAFYFKQFYDQYWPITQKMNEALNQEFRLPECLTKEELEYILQREISPYAYQATNSCQSADLYLSKKYPFPQSTHNNIRRRIQEQHKANFIKFVDEILKSLQ